MYTLYYYPLNASMAPHFVLEHLSCNFKLELVDRKNNAQKSEDYLKLNPLGKIPVLIDDGKAMFESPAICLHLADKHPESNLAPELASPERATFYQWLMYLTNTLQAELMIYFYPERHCSQDAELTKDTQEERIANMFTVLDKELEGKNFLVGNKVSICDYYLFMLSIWADEIKKPPLSFSNLNRYLKSMAKLGAVVRACNTEGFSLSDYK